MVGHEIILESVTKAMDVSPAKGATDLALSDVINSGEDVAVEGKNFNDKPHV